MNRSDDYIMKGASGSGHDQWKRVFDDASEPPPPRIWEAVERQLDLDQEDGIIPLWQHRQGQQSMLFGRWSAGIAASLLLTLFGWWAWHRGSDLRPGAAGAPQVAVAPPSAAPEAPTPPTAAPPQPTVLRQLGVPEGQLAHHAPARARQKQPTVTAESIPAPAAALATTDPVLEPALPSVPEPISVAGEAVAMSATSEPAATRQPVTTRLAYGQFTMSTTTRPLMSANGPGASTSRSTQVAYESRRVDWPVPPQVDLPGSVPPSTAQAAASTNEGGRLASNLAPLAIQPMSIRPTGNDRIVWYRAEQATDAPVAATSKTPAARTDRRKAWVSAGVVASTFNPDLALRSGAIAPLASAHYLTNNSPVGNSPSINAQTGRAVAIQVNTGLPLGEHWAIETGLAYLSSQAGVQSPVRNNTIYNGSNGVVGAFNPASQSTLYADLLSERLSSHSVSYTPTTGVASDMLGTQKGGNYTLSEQTVSNTYQFVQVPAQVSYEFRPRRKFGLALLTGFVSNWFVRNTVNQAVEVKPSDGVYRPVTMAGTAGVRFRYRPDRHWSASMAGTFQQHLQSLTRNDVSLQALPQQVGLSFTVDRHF